jgi:hypothetical protein
MRSGKYWLVAAAAVTSFVAAGCGETSNVTFYKQGQYQGKPDTQPWAGDQFKGDRATWEKTLKARNESQNEYVRIAN